MTLEGLMLLGTLVRLMPDRDIAYTEIRRKIRHDSGGHHAHPIVIVDTGPPRVVGVGGHYVERPKGKKKRYVHSTRRIEVGLDWIEENFNDVGKKVIPAYHAHMLGVTP